TLQPVRCDSGAETTLQPPTAARHTKSTSGAGQVVEGRTARRMAAAFLRFRSVDRTQANREVAIQTPQPSEAGIGAKTGAGEMEQLPRLCVRRARTGAGE